MEKGEDKKWPGHHRVMKRKTSALHFLARQEGRRHMINNAHKDTLVSGKLTWEPQTNTTIYDTNKKSER